MWGRDRKLLLKFDKPPAEPEYVILRQSDWASLTLPPDIQEALNQYQEKGYSLTLIVPEDWT
jgi:hypothetical protein